ncbi:hypothetical protein C8R46DRAFT_1064758 [Mycena filopes]|nr:hypothetical protein C8R46DRAFT_1064758 [Mycena filopes]
MYGPNHCRLHPLSPCPLPRCSDALLSDSCCVLSCPVSSSHALIPVHFAIVQMQTMRILLLLPISHMVRDENGQLRAGRHSIVGMPAPRYRHILRPCWLRGLGWVGRRWPPRYSPCPLLHGWLLRQPWTHAPRLVPRLVLCILHHLQAFVSECIVLSPTLRLCVYGARSYGNRAWLDPPAAPRAAPCTLHPSILHHFILVELVQQTSSCTSPLFNFSCMFRQRRLAPTDLLSRSS